MEKVFLGINVSHGASAALIVNGEIVLAFQEERFNGVKNFVGYPKISIDNCISYAKSKKILIDEAAFSTIKNPIFDFKYSIENYYSVQDWLSYFLDDFFSKKKKNKKVTDRLVLLKKKRNIDQYLNYSKVLSKDYFNNYSLFRKMQKDYLTKQSKGLLKKISFIDHHTCHAYYAAFSPDIKEKTSAIVTLDSEGEGLNQTFWIFNKKSKVLKKITQSSECDLARIYRFITIILGMKPNQHEYKVMGLAPYAKNKYSMRVYKDVFKNILKVKNCKVIYNKRPKNLFSYLYNKTKGYRFDNIAGAVQILIEDITSKLINQINKKYNLNTFSISGGVSMNIKMNRTLLNLKCVKKIYVSPTGTDDSLAIGARYYLNKKNKQKFLKNIYLGQEISNKDLNKKNIYKLIKNKKNILIHDKVSHKVIAKLLKKGEIIAVARDREEFGARALGNRSIIANPSVEGIIQKINEQIKNRDFWMPFALTILDKNHRSFIKNEKLIDSDFMTIGFDTVKKNYHKIKNGTHPYDRTVRPQILKKDFNPNYYSIINTFYKITNIPAVLNTSLNLHGSPISSTISDIIYTFMNSGLKFLYLNDKILLVKKTEKN